MQATALWSLWQDLLLPLSRAFTTPGWCHFAVWVTGLALNVEEHTITQCLIGLDRPQDWKGQETFAETGFWNRPYLERALARLLETAPGRLWYGYHVSAGDDSKAHLGGGRRVDVRRRQNAPGQHFRGKGPGVGTARRQGEQDTPQRPARGGRHAYERGP
jgi:hypothetical protein